MRRVNNVMMIAAVVFLVACGPTDKERVQAVEDARIACLDKLCAGDKPPTPQPGTSAIKLNGQWYFSPIEYTMGFAGLAFYWPSKTPATGRADRQSYPERGQDFYDVAIEIFLRSHDGIMHGSNRYSNLLEAEKDGRFISKSKPRPGLEIWRIRETDSRNSGVWYVATEHVNSDPNGAVLHCEENDPKFDRCTTAFIWRPGIAADMRLRTKHGPDWPQIYQETTRVLQLLKKA